MASTYLTRTFGTATNREKGTISFWMKTSNSAGGMVGNYTNDTNRAILYWGGGSIKYYDGEANVEYNATARVLRDPNAWYHIVLMINTADGTQADRVRIYINGERQSPITGNQAYNQNENSHMFNPTSAFSIGRDTYSTGGQDYFNGAISHFHYCDGQAYDASSFGETDTTTGEWKAKTSPSVTYGSQGFFILKNGNSVTDQSGNSNNFTVGGGTLTDLKDNPDNVFATLNPLNANIGATIPTLSMGNNRTSNSIINKMQTQYSTLAPETGKFYCEVKATAGSVFRIGISSYNSNQAQGSSDTQNRPGQFSEGWGYDKTGTVYKSESSVGSYTAYNTGDIICIALDMTNKKLYFKRDANAWENSANPATGSNGIDISSISSGTGMAFGAGLESGSVGAAYADFNFGNGYFGTTAVSSAGTNASEIGIFEYDVPTGYTALSTKGLNE